MSKPQRFFPQQEPLLQRPASRATFLADHNSSLHSSNADSKASSRASSFQPGTGRAPSGLGKIVKRNQSAQNQESQASLEEANEIARAATADSQRAQTRSFVNPNDRVSVIAPIPQKAARPSTGFLPTESAFKPPQAELASSHLVRHKMDENVGNGTSSIGMPTEVSHNPRFSNTGSEGPRRVPLSDNPAALRLTNRRSSVSINQDREKEGSLKRTRDSDERSEGSSPYHRPMKRFRQDLEIERASTRNSFSPPVERPSSSVSRHSFQNQATPDRSNIRSLREEPHVFPEEPSFTRPNNDYNGPTGGQYMRDSGALDRIFDRDCNAFAAEREGNYNKLLEKWSSCTFDEWLAGSDELILKFTKLIELNKKQLQEGMKRFASFTTVTHNRQKLLVERAQEFEDAKRNVVKQHSLTFP